MLVLTRRTGDEIAIPSLGVTIKVVSSRGNRTRLGIDAPHGLPIRRAELEPEIPDQLSDELMSVLSGHQSWLLPAPGEDVPV